MKLSKDQVTKVEKLANLTLSSESEEKYSEQLSKILDYIDTLNSVNVAGAEPIFNVTGNSNVLADDEISASLTQDEAIKNASNKKEGMFVTKGVFDNE